MAASTLGTVHIKIIEFWIQLRIDEYTGCLKIREFRIRSVVGDHSSSPNMEIKKKIRTPPIKIHWPKGALRFLQIQAEKVSVYC
jgi:hypothetical protein